jgi:hypothetical protein
MALGLSLRRGQATTEGTRRRAGIDGRRQAARGLGICSFCSLVSNGGVRSTACPARFMCDTARAY